MESIAQLLLILIKGIALLIGLAMLVGGGLCSIIDISALTSSPNSYSFLIISMWTLLSLVTTFCGYQLIRWVINHKNHNFMNLTTFLEKAQNLDSISFNDTIAVIDAHYDYQATEFSNGLGDDKLISPAGTNQGSCKIFAFGLLHNLTAEQTLNLFGDYYHNDVLKNPDGTDHQNIRNFIRYGWQGIAFQQMPLTTKAI